MFKPMKFLLITFCLVPLLACEDQPSSLPQEKPKEGNTKTEMHPYEEMIEDYLHTTPVDEKQVQEPYLFDITNDGQDEVILYNQVQPTDYDHPTTYIHIYNQHGEKIVEHKKDFIDSIEGIKNASFGNVLFLFSPTSSNAARGFVVAYEDKEMVELAELIDYGLEFDFIRNGSSHDILAFHIDQQSDIPIEAQQPTEVQYSWNENLQNYVLK